MPINASIPLQTQGPKLMDPMQMMSLQQMANQGRMQQQSMDEKNELRGAMRNAADPSTGRLTPQGIAGITNINPQLGLQLAQQQEQLRLQDLAFNEKKNKVAVDVGTTYVTSYDRYLQQTGGNKEQALNLARADTIAAIEELDRSGNLRLIGLDSEAIAGLRNLPDPERARTMVTALGGKIERPVGAAGNLGKVEPKDYTPESYAEYVKTNDPTKLRKPDDAKWGDPYKMGEAWVQKNSKTGEIRQAVSRPPVTNVTTTIRENDKKFEKEDKLRNDYTANPTVKAASEMSTAFKMIEAAYQRPSAANDLAMATKYMKILDPTSVVRESEFALAVNATGLLDKVQNYAASIMEGKKLNPTQRKDFYESAKAINESFQKGRADVDNEYSEMAKSYGLEPKNVIPSLRRRKTDKSPDDPLSPEERSELEKLRARFKK